MKAFAELKAAHDKYSTAWALHTKAVPKRAFQIKHMFRRAFLPILGCTVAACSLRSLEVLRAAVVESLAPSKQLSHLPRVKLLLCLAGQRQRRRRWRQLAASCRVSDIVARLLTAAAAARVAQQAALAGHAARRVDQFVGGLLAVWLLHMQLGTIGAGRGTAPRLRLQALLMLCPCCMWHQWQQLLLLLRGLLLIIHLDIETFHIVQITVGCVIQCLLVLVRHQHGHGRGRTAATGVGEAVVAE